MISLSVQHETNAVVQRLDGMIQRLTDLGQPLTRLGEYHQKKAQRVLRSGERNIKARNPSGLASSITFRISPPTGLEVGSNKSYAASQQFGPEGGRYHSNRPGGYLAIPFADNIVARGNAKYQSPRDVPEGFFIRGKSGHLLFIRERNIERQKRTPRQSNNRALRELALKNIEPNFDVLFILLPSVKGEAHHYVTHDAADQVVWDKYWRRWIETGNV